MALLTKGRNTARREDSRLEEHPVKGGVVIFQGALVCLDAARLAIPGREGVGLVAIGCALNRAAPASDGGETIRIRRGVYCYANSSGGDLISRAAIGSSCYVVDDQTVALTSASGARSVAGKVRDVDASGVWVEF